MAPTIVCQFEDCPAYRDRSRPLRRLGEFPNGWRFGCDVCQRLRFVTKDKVGGTPGAGDVRADGRRSVLGVGWRP
jgi:hypothetical protein